MWKGVARSRMPLLSRLVGKEFPKIVASNFRMELTYLLKYRLESKLLLDLSECRYFLRQAHFHPV